MSFKNVRSAVAIDDDDYKATTSNYYMFVIDVGGNT